MSWSVYIIEATDGSLYTGVTTDLDRRWREHTGTGRGAKFFRGSRQPRRIRYSESVPGRSEALRREVAIKRLSRAEKLELIGEGPA